jgi:hypothetical protein
MAQIVLEKSEIACGSLPRVCVRCGEAASDFGYLRYFSFYRIGWLRVPLCELHRVNWSWRMRVDGLVGGVAIVMFYVVF